MPEWLMPIRGYARGSSESTTPARLTLPLGRGPRTRAAPFAHPYGKSCPANQVLASIHSPAPPPPQPLFT